MPFRLFHVYETEIEVHHAADRISNVHAAALAGSRSKETPLPEGLREELRKARHPEGF